MMPTLKAEFKKLLTVRSTYFVTLLIVFLTGLFTYLGTSPIWEVPQSDAHQAPAIQADSANPSGDNPKQASVEEQPKLTKDLPKEKIVQNLQDSITAVSLLITIVVILLMAHEFRYNTITYTLTSTNRRSKVLLSKLVVAIAYTVTATLIAIFVTVTATHVAVDIKSLNLPTQDIEWPYIIARLLGYATTLSLLGLALITLLRNLTAAIVAMFILPIINSIIGAYLTNHNIEPTKYLLFSAIDRVGQVGGLSDFSPTHQQVSLARAIGVIMVYLGTVWLVSWYLFLRRDAS